MRDSNIVESKTAIIGFSGLGVRLKIFNESIPLVFNDWKNMKEIIFNENNFMSNDGIYNITLDVDSFGKIVGDFWAIKIIHKSEILFGGNIELSLLQQKQRSKKVLVF